MSVLMTSTTKLRLENAMTNRTRVNRWMKDRAPRPRHRNKVWNLAKALCLEIYRITSTFPDDEKYGLSAQLRRAAVSIGSNVVEGSARRTTKSYLRFLYMSRASLEELDAQMELADDLRLLEVIDLSEARQYRDELSKTLQGLINTLERK